MKGLKERLEENKCQSCRVVDLVAHVWLDPVEFSREISDQGERIKIVCDSALYLCIYLHVLPKTKSTFFTWIFSHSVNPMI
jgi:hypothetical protein